MLLDTKLLAQVLLSSTHHLSADILRNLEEALPTLTQETETEEMWRRFVLKHYTVREIPSPFPIMVASVNKHVETLTSSSSSVAKKQDVLDELYCIPFSDELAKQTSVALRVNAIRKDSTLPSSLSTSAGQLTTRWKQIFKEQQRIKNTSEATTTASKSLFPGLVSAGIVGLESVNILTWRQLYSYYEEKERQMVEKGTKKFSDLSNSARDKRKTSKSAIENDLSKHKKQKLQRVIEDTGQGRSSGSVTVFRRPGGSALSEGVVRSVRSSKGHSAVDVLQARALQSTKKIAVIPTSSGGVMQVPKWLIERNKRR